MEMWYHKVSGVIKNYTKFANFTGLYFQQYFVTKLCNFTLFRILLSAVQINFPNRNSKVSPMNIGPYIIDLMIVWYSFML